MAHEGERGVKSVRVRYLDTSALVKLYIDEPDAYVLRAYFNAHAKPFFTSWLCVGEAFGVFKRRWTNGQLPTEDYFGAVRRLSVALWGNEVGVERYGEGDPFVIEEVRRIDSENPTLGFADALQLLTLLKGKHSFMREHYAPLFITADEGLATAARRMGVRVWDCKREPSPPSA